MKKQITLLSLLISVFACTPELITEQSKKTEQSKNLAEWQSAGCPMYEKEAGKYLPLIPVPNKKIIDGKVFKMVKDLRSEYYIHANVIYACN